MISHLHRSTDEQKMKSATSCRCAKRDFGVQEEKRYKCAVFGNDYDEILDWVVKKSSRAFNEHFCFTFFNSIFWLHLLNYFRSLSKFFIKIVSFIYFSRELYLGLIFLQNNFLLFKKKSYMIIIDYYTTSTWNVVWKISFCQDKMLI